MFLSNVEGDARCFLGYVYSKRAQQACQLGRSDEEQLYLELAKKSLKVWLALTPGKEARKLGEQILRMFR